MVRHTIKSKITYNCWRIAFDRDGSQSFDNDFARSVIFGVDNTSSSYTDNWKDRFLVLWEGPTDCINDCTHAAEKIFSISFIKANARFTLQWQWELFVYK